MKYYTSSEQLIGNTPLLELTNFEKLDNDNGKIFAKLEMFNNSGSSKARVGLKIIEDAISDGILKKGATIIEPTSGNTGIGLASICAIRGYELIIVMPDTMSKERRDLMKAYGAKLVLTDGKLGMEGAVNKANEIHEEIPGSIIAGQFTNASNAKAHYHTTGPEIWEDTDGKVDIFVATVGTGGTLTGVGEFLKEKNHDIKVIAVEPKESPLLSEGRCGAHGIQGIGANFVPEVLNKDIIDEIVTVSTDEAIEMSRKIGTKEGLLVGISSGAAIKAAINLRSREEYANKNIVVVCPDSGERYLSSGLY